MDNDRKNREDILALLAENRLVPEGEAPIGLEKLTGDGSDRLFYRINREGGSPLMAVFPSLSLDKGHEEAAASFRIGVHLHDQGVPVPEILAYDRKRALIVFEDLGDLHLHSLVERASDFSEVRDLYRQAIEALLRFQIRGREGFDTRYCWDTPRYDEQLMLERESGYFSTAFCQDYLGRINDDPSLDPDFIRLARRAARQRADFLLHRDFQSRNLMVKQNRIRIIDYQGARLGPLAYDLASLLIDPYAGLDEAARDELLDYYLERAADYIELNADRFREGYVYLALQRNLQILGAFAFLSQKRAKPFFEQFIPPALRSLATLLQGPRGGDFPALTGLVEDCIARLAKMPPASLL